VLKILRVDDDLLELTTPDKLSKLKNGTPSDIVDNQTPS